jgi:two-component system, NarL family, sensor histidine kinase DesK
MRLLPKDNELGWTPWAWLIYIVPFVITPAAERWRAGLWIATLAATVVFIALYLRSYWSGDRERLLITAAVTLLGIIFWPWSAGAGAFFIYAAAMVAHHARPATAVRVIAAIALIVVIEAWIGKVPVWAAAWPLVFTVMVGSINVHFSQVGRQNARLRLAQDEIEHLAKLAERERIARDLHDLLGHTLSVIILKSELASKLAERDVERARNEIRDVERISRDALTQVRAAVRGYRSGGLGAEISDAGEALEAAGVTLTSDIANVALPPSHEAVLSMAMREAVTNIVRHAQAKQCAIRIESNRTHCVLTVIDDGRGGREPFGSGLTGMRERVEALGGTLHRDGTRGTTLTITLPLQATSLRESA